MQHIAVRIDINNKMIQTVKNRVALESPLNENRDAVTRLYSGFLQERPSRLGRLIPNVLILRNKVLL